MIHVSDIIAFRTCRRKHWFSSPLQRNLERLAPYQPFFLGRGIHLAMQEYYEKGIDPVETWQAFVGREIDRLTSTLGPLWGGERAATLESITLGAGMLSHYKIWQTMDQSSRSDKNYEFVAHELVGETEFPNGIPYSYRVDGVWRRKDDKSYWLLEHKTCSSIKQKKELLVNDVQSRLYMWAAEKVLGVTISGVLYNLLRKKLPVTPHELSKGFSVGPLNYPQLSQDKSMDTTFEHYRSIIDEVAWEIALNDPDEYHIHYKNLREFHAPILDHLWSKGNTFFERYEFVVPPVSVSNTVGYAEVTAGEMLNPATVLGPSGGEIHCTLCPFRAPCLVMDNGGDPESILQYEYQKRVPWEEQ